jgi:hypothetical protein
VSEETQELLARVAELQQEKWNLEEKVWRAEGKEGGRGREREREREGERGRGERERERERERKGEGEGRER